MDNTVFFIVIVSDSCSLDPKKDRSGARLHKLIADAYGNIQILTNIVPDEQEQIENVLRQNIAHSKTGVIITIGGTGCAPRDVTPEATNSVIEKHCLGLSMAITLFSLQKTKFAILSRGICGIAGKKLILNFPGNEDAVIECFAAVRDILPHALNLIDDNTTVVKHEHKLLHAYPNVSTKCLNESGTNWDDIRKSPFPKVQMSQALSLIFAKVLQNKTLPKRLVELVSPVNIPPFRASIKDGYAMNSSGFSGVKKVIGFIAAGDEVNNTHLREDECFKINTGAPIPKFADCVIQIEDTKIFKLNENGEEDLVEILLDPTENLNIREIGQDLKKGGKLFPAVDYSPVVIKSLYSSIGKIPHFCKPKIAIVSTGSELMVPNNEQSSMEKIFDSNSTMLEELLVYFGFSCIRKIVLEDNYSIITDTILDLFETTDFVICSGGVSMGDKDYIKQILLDLNFKIHFGRVNVKPGTPMTFASKDNKYFFGLPGNPVSAFVTFHLFVLPALRWADGWNRDKCTLPIISVKLKNDSIPLDPRPEYVRAKVTNKRGVLYAETNGDQASSRLQSIVGSDVLIHLPGRTTEKKEACAGEVFNAFVLRYDFISDYES